MEIVFVHGRSQQLKDPDKLHESWREALEAGAKEFDTIEDLRTTFPYYGNALATRERERKSKGGRSFQEMGDYEKFLGQFLSDVLTESLRVESTSSDRDALIESAQRGLLNWEWIQKALEFVDEKFPKLGNRSIERFTSDVYVYLTDPEVQTEINEIVSTSVTGNEAIVVAHSLGTIVAYNVLVRSSHAEVPLLVTLGSPLGVRSVINLMSRNQSLRYPKQVKNWLNGYDERDVVSLLPIHEEDYQGGSIENYSMIRNHTANRHGIEGYLDNPIIAGRVTEAALGKCFRI